MKGSSGMQRREITERKKLEMQMKDYFALADRIRKMECGGITEIKGSQNCPTIDGLARFAVDQNNKKVLFILSLFFVCLFVVVLSRYEVFTAI